MIISPVILSLHEKTLGVAKAFKRSERQLIDLLSEMDRTRGFVAMGYSSMRSYCVGPLRLSDFQAYSLVGIARKSRECPKMLELIDQGSLSVSHATLLLKAISKSNQEELLGVATQLTKRGLEFELKKRFPSKGREITRPICSSHSEVTLSVPNELLAALKNLQNIYSSKRKRCLTLAETLQIMTEECTTKHDPISRAMRSAARKKKTQISSPERPVATIVPPIHRVAQYKRNPIHWRLRYEVVLRDKHQCTHLQPDDTRCEERRFLHIHHIIPVHLGGQNVLENLTTLCSNHHSYLHWEDRWRVKSRTGSVVTF
ncbi:MAG: HNH endonuclease [Deltaproteobacteria bacterium]|nr:HNH endonuclease [Deltaproteobacteria bacterium]MBI3293319.1 HNH endonuclease [Deltaproteobacteria bacterium]